MSCPYCRNRPITSGDHIFPAFLGGHQTVPSCRECNSTFGGSFEGRVHRAVAPMQIMLATNGFALPNPDLAWRGAYEDTSDGTKYDLLPHFRMRPSKINLIPLPSGGFRIVGANKKQLKKVAEGFVSSGKARYPSEPTSATRQLPMRGVRLTLSDTADMRRVAVKCCIALLAKIGRSDAVDENALTWLNNGVCDGPEVRVVYSSPPTFASFGRPSHYIGIQTNDATGELVGVFRVFDVLSIYVQLATHSDGAPISHGARLDLTDLSEHFFTLPSLALQMPPKRVLRFVMAYDLISALRRLDSFVDSNFGRIRIRFAPSTIEANLMMRR